MKVLGFTTGDQAAEETHGVKGGSYHPYCGTPFEHRCQEEGIASVNIITIISFV